MMSLFFLVRLYPRESVHEFHAQAGTAGYFYKVSRLFTLKIQHLVLDFQGKITL